MCYAKWKDPDEKRSAKDDDDAECDAKEEIIDEAEDGNAKEGIKIIICNLIFLRKYCQLNFQCILLFKTLAWRIR